MSPEQAEGHPVGPASDVFSLGNVVAFAVTGHALFGTGDGAALLYRVVHSQPDLGGIPGRLRPLVQRCLSKDPARRPTAAQFLADLTVAYPGTPDLAGDWLPPPVLTPTATPTPPAPPAPSGLPVPSGP
jgi:eukaryotic-like serine/threonine-protein kinase